MNNDSQQSVRQERMRMSRVRRVLGMALEGEAPVEDPIPVYLASADYLEHSLNRLHAQDHRLWERLDPHAGPDDLEFREKLDHLKARLAASENALAGLVQSPRRPARRWRPATRRVRARSALVPGRFPEHSCRQPAFDAGRGGRKVRQSRLGIRSRQYRCGLGARIAPVRASRGSGPRSNGFAAAGSAPSRPLAGARHGARQRLPALELGHADRRAQGNQAR